ncbi:MAG: DegT/DnrJ/EryC1/StrS family aminotransferase [Bacteroidales bacterium]
MKDRIHLSFPHVSGGELKYIERAIEGSWIVPLGPDVNAFERGLKHYLGGDCYPVALSAGTAAIHLALIQLGVGYGDEVICQSFTFSASANPIVYLGAKPVFVDSEVDSWNISPELLEVAIEDRIKVTGCVPKAIVVVDLYGMPANMEQIMGVADKYSIPIVEDAAEALGSRFKGEMCGSFGDFGVLSFNGNKIITTSGGGALICHNTEMADKTIFLSTQARDNAPHYQHSEVGYNYRMSNIAACIGCAQLEELDERVERRREINAIYRAGFKSIDGISFQSEPTDDYFSNYWLTTMLFSSELVTSGVFADVVHRCVAENIETRPLWKPLHLQPVFESAPFYGDGTSERLFSCGICLPSGSSLTNEQVYYVINTIKGAF